MNTQTEALKRAQDLAYSLMQSQNIPRAVEVYYACKDALAEAEKQEPVAERFLMKDNGKSYWVYDDYQNSKGWQALYTKEQI